MTPLKGSLVAALAAVIVTAGGLQYFQRNRNKEAARLRGANDRLRNQIFQSVQSQTREKAKPVSTPIEMPANLSEPAPGASVAATDSSPDYRNEGQTTPHATLQTLAWSCDRGDRDAVERMLYFDEAARAKAESIMAALPDSVRAKWNSPEEMMAALITDYGIRSPFPSARILETAAEEPITPERVRLRLPGTPKDRTEYQKTSDGWKLVVTEEIVGKITSYLTSNQSPSH